MVSSAWSLQESQTSAGWLGPSKDGYQQNKRVIWELYHLLWLALKVIQCYVYCILLIRSNDNPWSRAGEFDFIYWWRECQGMCGHVSRSPHTHGKTCYLSRQLKRHLHYEAFGPYSHSILLVPVSNWPCAPLYFYSSFCYHMYAIFCIYISLCLSDLLKHKYHKGRKHFYILFFSQVPGKREVCSLKN